MFFSSHSTLKFDPNFPKNTILWAKELFCKSIQKSQNTYLEIQEQNVTKRRILTINHCWNYLWIKRQIHNVCRCRRFRTSGVMAADLNIQRAAFFHDALICFVHQENNFVVGTGSFYSTNVLLNRNQHFIDSVKLKVKQTCQNNSRKYFIRKRMKRREYCHFSELGYSIFTMPRLLLRSSH